MKAIVVVMVLHKNHLPDLPGWNQIPSGVYNIADPKSVLVVEEHRAELIKEEGFGIKTSDYAELETFLTEDPPIKKVWFHEADVGGQNEMWVFKTKPTPLSPSVDTIEDMGYGQVHAAPLPYIVFVGDLVQDDSRF